LKTQSPKKEVMVYGLGFPTLRSLDLSEKDTSEDMAGVVDMAGL
jgi:hypothetical protein